MPEVRGYHFLVSVSYPYPFPSIRIRIRIRIFPEQVSVSYPYPSSDYRGYSDIGLVTLGLHIDRNVTWSLPTWFTADH